MAQETHLTVNHLIYPLFLSEGKGIKDEITSLPGNFRMSLDNILKEIDECMNLGLMEFHPLPRHS